MSHIKDMLELSAAQLVSMISAKAAEAVAEWTPEAMAAEPLTAELQKVTFIGLKDGVIEIHAAPDDVSGVYNALGSACERARDE